MFGTSLRHVLIFFFMLQATHWKILDGATAHILQQSNGGFYRHDAIWRGGAQWPGGDLHPTHFAGWRYQAVNHSIALPQQRTASTDASEHLIHVLRLH
ncbi:hypothetical protein D3C73_1376690 [compost metagenome]